MSEIKAKWQFFGEMLKASLNGNLESIKFIMQQISMDFGISHIAYFARLGNNGFILKAEIGKHPTKIDATYPLVEEIDLEELKATGFLVTLDSKHPFDLYFPFIVSGEIVGVIAFDDLNGKRDFLSKQDEMMCEIGNILKQFTLRDLYEVAFIDPLTNLYNRGYLERERRHLNEFGCTVMIDLDYFKVINDTYGHGAGDNVLQRFGALLRDFFRVHMDDILVRWGGEEFLVIIRHPIAPNVVFQKVTALKNAFKAIQFQFCPDKQLTFSAGIYFPSNQKMSLQEAIDAADANLYRAKHEGRDKIVTN